MLPPATANTVSLCTNVVMTSYESTIFSGKAVNVETSLEACRDLAF